MATLVTRATLANSLPKFIRDVLRNNLTDTQSPTRSGSAWIFKEMPEEKNFSPPFVIVDTESEKQVPYSINGAKQDPNVIVLEIRVFARKMANRDSVAAGIANTINDDSKTDGTNSMSSQYVSLVSIESGNENAMIDKFPKPFRVRRMTCTFVYRGV